jgi:hypothetical protein
MSQNIKVISANGQVTLPGPVRSDQEKNAIASDVHRVVGVNNVDNRLEVVSQYEKKMKKAVFGIAKTESQAINIANGLKESGFFVNDISVLLPDKSGTRDFAHEQHTKAPEGAATVAGSGVVLGGALGWLVGTGALAIPGVGPFIAAGPIMAALAGAGAGAAAGGPLAL